VLLVGAAIERALAGDRDVLLFESVDERGVIHALHALPTRVDQRQVVSRIAAEADGGVAGNMQVDAAEQVDGTGEKLAGRHDHAASARVGAGFNRFAEGRGAVGLAVAARAKYGQDEHLARGELGRPDARQNLRQLRPRVGFGGGKRGRAGEQAQRLAPGKSLLHATNSIARPFIGQAGPMRYNTGSPLCCKSKSTLWAWATVSRTRPRRN
jgi:hypothetical protein